MKQIIVPTILAPFVLYMIIGCSVCRAEADTPTVNRLREMCTTHDQYDSGFCEGYFSAVGSLVNEGWLLRTSGLPCFDLELEIPELVRPMREAFTLSKADVGAQPGTIIYSPIGAILTATAARYPCNEQKLGGAPAD